MTARDEPADGLLLGKDFAPAGARYFCPWWQKYPKAPFKGKGISYFPFPLKIPHPLKRPMRGPRPPPLEPPPGERGPRADVHRKCTVGRGDHTPPPVMRQDICGGMWGAIRALPVADEARCASSCGQNFGGLNAAAKFWVPQQDHAALRRGRGIQRKTGRGRTPPLRSITGNPAVFMPLLLTRCEKNQKETTSSILKRSWP